MADQTKIQWADTTINPVMGCGGCELYVPGDDDRRRVCYAGCDHDRKGPYNTGFAPTFLLPTLYRGRMAKAARLPDLRGKSREDKPWLGKMPRLIFVSDMGDALSAGLYGKKDDPGQYIESTDIEVIRWAKDKKGRDRPCERRPRDGAVKTGGVPFNFLKSEIVDNVKTAAGRRHQWLWLTKRPDRMTEFSDWLRDTHGISWPKNLWAGASVTGTGTLWRAEALLGVGDETTTRFISAEPLWNEISLLPILAKHPAERWLVITGGESRQRVDLMPRPLDLAWVRKLRDECKSLGVAFFVKQLGGNVLDDGRPLRLARDPKHAGDWSEWPVDLRIREMPPIAGAARTGNADEDDDPTLAPTEEFDAGDRGGKGAISKTEVTTSKPKPMTGNQRQRIVELLAEEQTSAEIASALHVTVAQVRAVKAHITMGTYRGGE